MKIIKYTESGVPVIGVNESRRNIYLHNCFICGDKFTSLGIASKYCDRCKDTGLIRGVDHNICLMCGKPFVGRNGYQKHCFECEKNEDENLICSSNGSMSNEDSIKLLVEAKVIKIINQSREKGLAYNDRLIDYRAIGGFNEIIKNKVRERDGFKCQVCGKDTDLHIHHIIPRRMGGSHDLNNLILLCSSCHMAIETNDVDHAVKKCTNNALKYGGFLEDNCYRITDSYKVNILKETLIDVFKRLSSDSSYKDILVDISSALSKVENQ